MSTKPLLSILVPYYNAQESLPRLLETILTQSLKSIEVVVVDDGSRDSCRDVTDAWRNKGLNLRLIEHGVNKGTKEARLTGIEHSRGRIVAFADADDQFLGVNVLEQHVRLLLREEADIVHFNAMTRIKETGREIIRDTLGPFALQLEGEDVFATYASAKAPMIWGKLFLGELCRACRPAAGTLDLARFSDDFYLTSLFFSQARKYRGSDLLGYCYNRTLADTLPYRWTGRICAMHAIVEWFTVRLRDRNFSPRVITAFKRKAGIDMLNFSAELKQATFTDAGVFNQDAFQKLANGIDLAALSRALEFSVAEGPDSPRKKSAISILRQEVSKLARCG
jgi:glycosyltransferase involved in cell wall biosynthesis